MLNYYFALAVRSLRRNVILTALMIAAIGVGIGAAMTVYTVLQRCSHDPIPDKSSLLFAPQIDNWGPDAKRIGPDNGMEDQVSYPEAMALMRAKKGVRQTAMYVLSFDVQPGKAGAKPFHSEGRGTYRDFFPMFEAPFAAGGPWTSADDDSRANVAVLGATLAARLFPQGDAVGRTITLDQRDYRVVGVLKAWNPAPRFYDVTSGGFGQTEDVFIPFSTAIDRQMLYAGNNNCAEVPPPGWEGHLNSDCVWIQFWVELPNVAAAADYRQFIYNYAAEQQRIGHFHWPPHFTLLDVRQWLVMEKVVPDEFRVSTLIAFAFLIVCLLNAIGLMLAKFSHRAQELGVRRALGASRGNVFLQCLMESAVVGLVGGVLGLGLTAFGLMLERSILDEDTARLAHLNVSAVLITLALAVLATISSGLYPAWRASRVQPAWQLKAQ